jgi:uncharacterized protein YgbK (DUF1537 family)
MKELGYGFLIPKTEIQPGIVLVEAEGEKGETVLVTKSGAFGEKDLISIIANYFSNLQSP